MNLNEIIAFWGEQRKDSRGRWIHPRDATAFDSMPHTFNLDFPVSPFVGDILNAPVLILGANAGYDPEDTPQEFAPAGAIKHYVERVLSSSSADWRSLAVYYKRVNYGPLLIDGRAALINACPYRSSRISSEPQNRALLERLPSTTFARRWLLEAVLPLAQSGQRLVIAKRPGLWKIPAAVRHKSEFIFDPAPVSPQITSRPWQAVQQRLRLFNLEGD